MKAFLLAAGNGTRLRPLTDSIPKCLVPVRGVPMLKIWLDLCRRAGIREVLVNLHSHADVVRDAVGEFCDGITVHLAEEPVLLGSAGTLYANRDWLAHDASFWIFYADVLTNIDLTRMQAWHEKLRAEATVGVYEAQDPSRCGVVAFDKSFTVNEFVEKPVQPKSNCVFSGIMLAQTSVLDKIPVKHPADIGFDMLPKLVGRMKAYFVKEYLLDVGTMENYRRAQNTWPGL